MAEILQPRWPDLEALVHSASTTLTVITPFYSEEGVTRVLDSLQDRTSVTVVTRLSPSDWAAGVADPEALYTFLDLLPGRHELSVLRNLHAKVYVADRREAIVGSSNLTDGGFGRNIELAVRLRDAEAEAAVTAAMLACSGRRLVAIDDLQTWIRESLPAIERARTAASESAEDLQAPQARLDELLGFGVGPTALADPGITALPDFVRWLERHPDLAGADMLARRYHNADGQNLQGHVKQSFYATVRFLEEYAGLRTELSAALAGMAADDIYQLSAPVAEAWNRHVDDHALDSGDEWSYAILRGQLPVPLGGMVANGGGASSTLKRMLPLVARYLLETRMGGAAE